MSIFTDNFRYAIKIPGYLEVAILTSLLSFSFGFTVASILISFFGFR